MIYTVTFNPALDYIVSVESFALGRTNRTDSELLLAGGKGINVSLMLKNLGQESTALGFVAGFTGKEIERRLEEAGCHTEFVTLPKGASRINVKLKNTEGTEINGRGPDIDTEDLKLFLEKLDTLQSGDILVLAGSIPASMPKTLYRDICKRLEGQEVSVVVDAAGELLTQVLPQAPFLIKPNHHELGEIFGREFDTPEEIVPYARKLQEMGARNVLVSMGGKGAVLAAEDGRVYMAGAPEGVLVNSVGAGDSMVAGFLAGFLESGEYEKAFRMGIASGSASAFSENFATLEDVEALLKKM